MVPLDMGVLLRRAALRRGSGQGPRRRPAERRGAPLGQALRRGLRPREAATVPSGVRQLRLAAERLHRRPRDDGDTGRVVLELHPPPPAAHGVRRGAGTRGSGGAGTGLADGVRRDRDPARVQARRGGVALCRLHPARGPHDPLPAPGQAHADQAPAAELPPRPPEPRARGLRADRGVAPHVHPAARPDLARVPRRAHQGLRARLELAAAGGRTRGPRRRRAAREGRGALPRGDRAHPRRRTHAYAAAV